MFLFSDDPLFTDEELFLMCAASGGKTVQDTATGNPLTFVTDLARPLKSLLIPFTPRQSGTGDPSPSNIRSILPWNGLKVWNGGGNICDESKITYNRAQKVDNVYESTETDTRNQFLMAVQLYDENKTYIKNVSDGYASVGRRNVTVNVDVSNCKYVCFRHNGVQKNLIEIYIPFDFPLGTYTLSVDVLDNDPTKVGGIKVSDIQLSAGQTATAYEPYTPITETEIPFTSPVYGGTLDVVSGVLTVEWICYDLSDFTWEEYATNRVRSNYLMDKPIVYPATSNDYPEVIAEEYIPLKQSGSLASNHNGLIIMPRSSESAGRVLMYFDGENYPSGKACFKLATPQEITLTPEQITALVGNNTIWSDADGSMTAVYLKKG